MQKLMIKFLILTALLIGFGASQANAQSNKPLKGTFTFQLKTPVGVVNFDYIFKANGKGSVSYPVNKMSAPLSYREKGSDFSLVLEVPENLSPVMQSFTLLLRGSKTSDSEVSGALVVITDNADANNPSGYGVITGSFTGTRTK